jgi:hypothetical protein
LCRQICVDQNTYPFIPYNHRDKGLRSDLLIGLVLFVDDQKPVKYLFPSTVRRTPNQLFADSSAKLAEYGISANKKTVGDLAEEKIQVIDELFKKSDLPNEPNLIEMEALLINIRDKFYR